MSKYTPCLFVVIGLVVSMTLTLGEELNDVSDLMNPTYLWNNPEVLAPEKECPVVCAAECTATDQACVDIPDQVDCAANLVECNSLCDSMCGCLTGCANTCNTPKCEGDGLFGAIMQLGCLSQQAMCNTNCQLNCTAASEVEIIDGASKFAVKETNLALEAIGIQTATTASP